METQFLYPDMLPLQLKRGQGEIRKYFLKELLKADEIRISAAYFSRGSLELLDKLIYLWNIKRVCLILGMYDEENFPKKSYKLARKINEKWQKQGKGEIRMMKKWKNHEKLYCFLRNGQIFSAITGSPNLSFLHSGEHPQYERATLFKDPVTLKDFLEHINDLLVPSVTENINRLFLMGGRARTKFIK